jgi:mannose-1-phosphate guanylyltransferase
VHHTGQVFAIIMAGGGGTRLWPASRRRRPKQFLPLLPGGETLLGATVARLTTIAPPERILIVTARGQVDEVRRTAPSVPAANVVVEPQARNTAACIGLGAVEAMRRDPDAILAVLPSDQHILHTDRFAAALREAVAVARRGLVVTIGIRPDRPETGYGYIEVGAPLDGAEAARAVARFVEKPDRPTAERYLAAGTYLWNSGMFFFSARRVLAAISTHLPKLGQILDAIAADPARAEALYPEAPSTSIDYGVMEKLGPGEVAVVPGDLGWNDVGAWSAVPDLGAPDAQGNVTLGGGDAVTVDARGNLVYATAGRVVTALGVDDLCIVATDDAVLVLPKSRAQDVREIVRALEQQKRDSYL